MPGNDETRFCNSCNKHVHDLSARTEDEARALLDAARGTRICVRYAKDTRGTIRFRAVTMAAAVSLAACTGNQGSTSPAVAAPVPEARAHVQAEDGGAILYDMGDIIGDVEDRCPNVPVRNDDGCPEPPPRR